MARHVDDIAFIHSMTSKTNTHGPGCVFMNTGHAPEGFPERRGLAELRAGQRERQPADLRRLARHLRANRRTARRTGATASCPRSIRPIVMAASSRSAICARPAGDHRRTRRQRVARLPANAQRAARCRESRRQSDLQARMAAYELAARMQLSAPRSVRSCEPRPRHAHQLYGTDDANKLRPRMRGTACSPAGCSNAACAT